jgi:hypothetical protein
MNDSPASLAEIAESTGLIERIRTAAAAQEPSKAALKLIQGIEEIKGDALGETAFLARFLVQCTLPHKDPGKVPAWRRKNGAYTLVIQPGWDDRNECPMGYPYGILPRLILIWMVTEAKRTGVRRLHLGGRLADFSHELGLDTSKGGKRSDTARVKDQFARLIMSHISYRKRYQDTAWDGEKLQHAEMEYTRQQPIVEESQIGWWTPGKRALFASYIDLSPTFFAAIMESAIPFDMRAIAVLRKSPLALDLYLFCNYIGANLKQRGKTKHLLTWKMLGQQLGCDYANPDDLKRKIKAAMRKVKLAHPGLKVGYPSKGGGLEIYVSKPAIAPRVKVDQG